MRLITTSVAEMTAEQRTFVDEGFAAGLAEGAFPPTREPPYDTSSIVLAVMGDEYVGFASFYIPDHYPIVWLDVLYVDPAFRRRSIATFLASGVMAFAQRENLPFECGTLMTNAAMQGLAASLGLEGSSILYRKEPVR